MHVTSCVGGGEAALRNDVRSEAQLVERLLAHTDTRSGEGAQARSSPLEKTRYHKGGAASPAAHPPTRPSS